jgi:hypothetical protein
MDQRHYRVSSTVRVFRHNFALEDAIGSHACSLEVNNIACDQRHSSRESAFLTVVTINHVQTLKAVAKYAGIGGWNDPDALIGSSPGTAVHLTQKQSRAQMSLWSVMVRNNHLSASSLFIPTFFFIPSFFLPTTRSLY